MYRCKHAWCPRKRGAGVWPRAGSKRMLRERRRERESESRMYLCISGAGSVPDLAMVVLVGRCSILLKPRGVFYIWYICSS